MNLDRITKIHYSSRRQGQSKQDKTIQLQRINPQFQVLNTYTKNVQEERQLRIR